MKASENKLLTNLEEYIEKLKEVCAEKGYNIKISERANKALFLEISNPATSGIAKLLVDGRSIHGLDVYLGSLFYKGGLEGKNRRIKQMKLQLEILAEEFSRSGLSPRDELSARLALYSLITGFKIPNFIWENWRDCVNLARIALERGMRFKMEYLHKNFPIVVVESSNKKVKNFIEEYERTYQIDNSFITDLMAIIKKKKYTSILKNPERREILSSHFPPKVYASFALKIGNLTDRDYEVLRKTLFESNSSERLQMIKTIIDEHVYSKVLSKEELEKLEDTLIEYIDKKAKKSEIFRILNARWSAFFTTRDIEVIFPRFLKRSLEKALEIEITQICKNYEKIKRFLKSGSGGYVWTDYESNDDVLNILTKDGYQLLLSLKDSMKLYVRSRNKLFEGVYTYLNVIYSKYINEGHVEFINKFLRKSKLYIKKAIKLAREKYDETLIKMAAISRENMVVFAPPVTITIDALRDTPEKNVEAIEKIEKIMQRSLKSLEIAMGNKLLPAKKYVKI